MDTYTRSETGTIVSVDKTVVYVDPYEGKRSKPIRVPIRAITGHRIGRKGVSPSPKIPDTVWQQMALDLFTATRK